MLLRIDNVVNGISKKEKKQGGVMNPEDAEI